MNRKGSTQKITGQTKDVGFQIGVRRTLPIALDNAWDLVTSTTGLRTWLGETSGLVLSPGERYERNDGVTGELRVYKPGSHLRITWHPPGWPRSSTIQVRVIPSGDRTVIAFHQEHLPGREERETRRAHFKAALDRLEDLITRQSAGRTPRSHSTTKLESESS